MSREDPIRELVLRIVEAMTQAGECREEIAIEVEKQWRHQHSGERVYVAERRLARNEEREVAVRQYLEDRPVEHIKSTTGVSRSALYRHLKKR